MGFHLDGEWYLENGGSLKLLILFRKTMFLLSRSFAVFFFFGRVSRFDRV